MTWDKCRVNPFHGNFAFLYPLETFSGGIEMQHWHEMRFVWYGMTWKVV